MTQVMTKSDPFPPLKMTFDDFVEWAIKNEISAEWVDGEVEYKHVYTDPITGEKYKLVSEEHSALVVFLVTILNFFSAFHKLGRVYADQYLIRPTAGGQGREPDVIFVAKGNARVRIGSKFMEGPADLVIEVVSEESKYRDRVTKKGEYEQSGIREYWRLDPMTQASFFYVLDANGVYQEASLDAEGKFYSMAIPGLWVKPEWFWQGTNANPATILREWGLL